MNTNREYVKLNEDAGIYLDQVCRIWGPPVYFLRFTRWSYFNYRTRRATRL